MATHTAQPNTTFAWLHAVTNSISLWSRDSTKLCKLVSLYPWNRVFEIQSIKVTLYPEAEVAFQINSSPRSDVQLRCTCVQEKISFVRFNVTRNCSKCCCLLWKCMSCFHPASCISWGEVRCNLLRYARRLSSVCVMYGLVQTVRSNLQKCCNTLESSSTPKKCPKLL